MNEQLKETIRKALAEEKTTLTFQELATFISVESGGRGFDPVTGKLIIQLEPHLFSKYAKIPRDESTWSLNRVETQGPEWKAFNDAFRKNSEAAMCATSIGLPQILGVNFKACGYDSVGAMWDDFKLGELQQVKALIRFIGNNKKLLNAIKAQDWHTVASVYNGVGYRELAKKLGTVPYDVKLAEAYKKFQ